MDALGLTEQLSNYIIRPPRNSYSVQELGEQTFEYKNVTYQRIDFVVPPTKHTKKIQASIYVQTHKQRRPTLIYLHANSSSRMSMHRKNYLINLIQYFDVVAFDFRGCGLSDGEFLTLGFLEKYDVRAVIEYVEEKFGSRRYLLWGRSMGAVTALLYTATYALYSDKIAALVLDSPFADLQKIIYSLADKKVPLLPKFMLESAIQNLESHIKEIIQKQYNKIFLIRKHKPIEEITKIRIPIFFIGSKNDELVDSIHIKKLYDSTYCSRRQMQMLEGGHNQTRPEHLKVAVVEFLIAALQMKRQPMVRKKIFDFMPNISAMQNQGKNKNEEKSKSKSPQKGRLFKGKSNPKIRLSINQQTQKNQKQTILLTSSKQQSQIQFLGKALPNNGKRTHRIFSAIPNKIH